MTPLPLFRQTRRLLACMQQGVAQSFLRHGDEEDDPRQSLRLGRRRPSPLLDGKRPLQRKSLLHPIAML
jgi:hypothetical protein